MISNQLLFWTCWPLTLYNKWVGKDGQVGRHSRNCLLNSSRATDIPKLMGAWEMTPGRRSFKIWTYEFCDENFAVRILFIVLSFYTGNFSPFLYLNHLALVLTPWSLCHVSWVQTHQSLSWEIFLPRPCTDSPGHWQDCKPMLALHVHTHAHMHVTETLDQIPPPPCTHIHISRHSLMPPESLPFLGIRQVAHRKVTLWAHLS